MKASLQDLVNEHKRSIIGEVIRPSVTSLAAAEYFRSRLPKDLRYSIPKTELTDIFARYSEEVAGLTGSSATPAVVIVDEERQWGEIYGDFLRELHPPEFHEFIGELTAFLSGGRNAVMDAFSVSRLKKGSEAALIYYMVLMNRDATGFFLRPVLAVGNQVAVARERLRLTAYQWFQELEMHDGTKAGRELALQRIIGATKYLMVTALARMHLPQIYEQAQKLSRNEKSLGVKATKAIAGMDEKDIIAAVAELDDISGLVTGPERLELPPEYFALEVYFLIKRRIDSPEEAIKLPDKFVEAVTPDDVSTIRRSLHIGAVVAGAVDTLAEIVLKGDENYNFSRTWFEKNRTTEAIPKEIAQLTEGGRNFFRELYARTGRNAFQLLAKRLPTTSAEFDSVDAYLKNTGP